MILRRFTTLLRFLFRRRPPSGQPPTPQTEDGELPVSRLTRLQLMALLMSRP